MTDEVITTTDMFYAAALLTKGAKLELSQIDRTDPKHVKFAITGSELDQIETEWYERVLTVNIRLFVEKLRDLRNIIRG